jgi:hypothetical protein
MFTPKSTFKSVADLYKIDKSNGGHLAVTAVLLFEK